MAQRATVSELKDEINVIDTSLARLIAARAEVTKALHLERADEAYSLDKEKEALDEFLKESHKIASLLDDRATGAIYRTLRSACATLTQPVRVSYLGPAGTYTEMAVVKAFGEGVTLVPAATLDEALRLAEVGETDYAVLPIENSSQGTVTRTLDLLMKTNLLIQSEVYVKVTHCLMTKTGDVNAVRCVMAHPQALAQCQGWLNRHLSSVKLMPASSNAEAAREASKDSSIAAIAASRAATIYDLKIAQSAIQDNPSNQTRFVVLGKNAVQKTTGAMKTSLVFSTVNEAGALFDALAALKKYKISMTKLESRPSNNGAWEYNFFVDIEGCSEDKAVHSALKEMTRHTSFLKNLGSYAQEETNI